ncbi:cupin domain-containing protein [Thalassotalea euphylliae]|uniref:cupin domain-containing protein n=1 Tax=Thalassotalea euphylliae TaxID=1655234 RepID=UPI0036338E17
MLNLDFSEKVVISTQDMAWEESPSSGVARKKLEREAAESGHVTSVVKYQAGSKFSPHPHPRGEEILVLSGIFSDEHGDYPAGTYLRNPAGTTHAPFSVDGCELFVKLNQFQTDDNRQIALDTNTVEWLPGLVDGLSVKPLYSIGTEHVALVRWQPGTVFKPHVHAGGEEIFVLSGEFQDEFGSYPAGTWIRSPSYSKHSPFSEIGCTIWVKTGHLPLSGESL